MVSWCGTVYLFSQIFIMLKNPGSLTMYKGLMSLATHCTIESVISQALLYDEGSFSTFVLLMNWSKELWVLLVPGLGDVTVAMDGCCRSIAWYSDGWTNHKWFFIPLVFLWYFKTVLHKQQTVKSFFTSPSIFWKPKWTQYLLETVREIGETISKSKG